MHTAAQRIDAREAEGKRLHALIEQVLRACPVRTPTSMDEREAQRIIADALRAEGLEPTFEAFRFNESLYQNLLLHFGTASLATLIGQRHAGVAGLLHLLVAASYLCDNARFGFLLRRLLPWYSARNLVATSEARGSGLRHRVVFVAHADAAFTGKMFETETVRAATSNPWVKAFPLLGKGTLLATAPLVLVALSELYRHYADKPLPALRALEVLLSVPALITAALNLDVVTRHEIVPGASDNLSGAAALVLLAARLLPQQPDDVELVFVLTGAEEASLGGSDALSRDRQPHWDKAKTTVLAIDTLAGGALRYLSREGELVAYDVPQDLAELLHSVAAEDPRFCGLEPFEPPVGGSDALPFLARGFRAAAITRVDPEIGAPRNYHQPSDTLDNLDIDEVLVSLDYIERVCQRLMTP